MLQAVAQHKQHRQVLDLALSQLKLERSIGYGGFIHNFKNAVLRPNEPRYLEAASRQYDELMLALDELDEILAKAEVAPKTDAIRSTFAVYGSKLRILRAEGGVPSARELDLLVRVPDDAALIKLHAHLDELARRSKNDYHRSTQLIFLNLTCSGVIFAWVVSLLYRTARIRENLAVEWATLLETENDELNQANADLRSFSYALSHDLKSPTNTARMLLRELREFPQGDLTKGDRDFLDKTDRQLQRIQDLISDVLHYTQVVGDKVEKREVVDLNEMMRTILVDLDAEISEAEAQVNVAEAMPSLWAHPVQVRLLLQNLVSNAIKYRRDEIPCVVRIRAFNSPDSQSVSIHVHDNGPGIPPEYQQKVFEMFQRIDRRTDIPGTGLGLALCRRRGNQSWWANHRRIGFLSSRDTFFYHVASPIHRSDLGGRKNQKLNAHRR